MANHLKLGGLLELVLTTSAQCAVHCSVLGTGAQCSVSVLRTSAQYQVLCSGLVLSTSAQCSVLVLSTSE